MELTGESIQQLMDAARDASRYAFCPHTAVQVGAAVLTEDGLVFSAANVETNLIGLSICAERNAVFQAVSKGHLRIVAVAVFSPCESPVTPCGACRQVLSEFGEHVSVLSSCPSGELLEMSLDDLLPAAYKYSSL